MEMYGRILLFPLLVTCVPPSRVLLVTVSLLALIPYSDLKFSERGRQLFYEDRFMIVE